MSQLIPLVHAKFYPTLIQIVKKYFDISLFYRCQRSTYNQAILELRCYKTIIKKNNRRRKFYFKNGPRFQHLRIFPAREIEKYGNSQRCTFSQERYIYGGKHSWALEISFATTEEEEMKRVAIFFVCQTTVVQ